VELDERPAMSDEQRIDISVVVPCLNEEANVRPLAERFLAAAAEARLRGELVYVDDGSTDGTWAAIEELRAELGEDVVVGVRHEQNRGIAASWRTGLDAAQGAYACFIDADLQHPPEEIVTLYRRLLESRADIAQGTRSSIGRLRDSRLVLSRGLNVILNLAFRTWATDSKSGFVLAPRRVLRDVVSHRGTYRHFQTLISVAAKAKGYSVLEVETLFVDRRAGTSFLAGQATKVSLEALADIPPALREFGRKRHPHGPSVAPRDSAIPSADVPYEGWRRLWFEAYFATMPLHKWQIRRRARALYLELKQTERLPREELDAVQLRKLQRLVQHAYVHVPFYRDRMRELGVHPEDIRTLGDIDRLPLLSKDDVRKHLFFDLFADNHRKRDMLRVATSGSTGEPFVTYADRYQLEMRFATTLRALEWTGWRFGDPQARLWHQTHGLSRTQRVRERIDAWFMRRLFIPAFELSPGSLEEYVAKIRKHEPFLLDGYAESLNFLAAYLQTGDGGLSPKAVVSSAQTLPDAVRAQIEASLQTRVFDKYGSREFSGIAYQCEVGGAYHVMDESYVVELLVEGRPARPGEVGEVVVTDLNNFSVPLIRYRIGDLAVAVDQSRPCACGRNLSRIGEIQGRTQAIVHCADGTWLPGTFFSHFFKEYDHIVRFFQVVQEQRGAVTLRIVKAGQFTDVGFEELMAALREYIGDTAVEVEFVEEIPLVRTGKRSPVVSTVVEDFQRLSGESRSHGRRSA
jgi:phenylacetate-CoA ligase